MGLDEALLVYSIPAYPPTPPYLPFWAPLARCLPLIISFCSVKAASAMD